ncbi:MAG: phosphoribosyltransferase family protein [Bacteroidota bacterium]|nr:phosphoribosyltransferase family protein [Bacteroidota bacterium]
MFEDRKDAALQLAKALEKYKDKGAIVLGIPRGGAVTAYYVALHLHAEFSLLVSRKLGHPANPEYAVGAIAEDGTIHLNKLALQEATRGEIDEVVAQQKKEIERRIKILRKGEPLPEIRNKIVLIVDDGIATGATLFAAIKMCKNKEAAKIVVAAPVSGREIIKELNKEADEVIVLETPVFYHAVSLAYESFPTVTDNEALGFLEKWKKENTAPRQ